MYEIIKIHFLTMLLLKWLQRGAVKKGKLLYCSLESLTRGYKERKLPYNSLKGPWCGLSYFAPKGVICAKQHSRSAELNTSVP